MNGIKGTSANTTACVIVKGGEVQSSELIGMEDKGDSCLLFF